MKKFFPFLREVLSQKEVSTTCVLVRRFLHSITFLWHALHTDLSRLYSRDSSAPLCSCSGAIDRLDPGHKKPRGPHGNARDPITNFGLLAWFCCPYSAPLCTRCVRL